MKTKRAAGRGRRKAGSFSLGCLAWIALVVLLAAVAYALREPVKANVEKFVSAWQSAGKGSSASQPPAAGAPSGGSSGSTTPSPTQPPAQEPEPAPAASPQSAPSSAPSAAPVTPRQSAPQSAPSAAPETPSSPAVTASKPARRTARLYFVRVGKDGGTSLVPVDRSLPVSDSPLRDVIVSLIAGPSAAEKAGGLESMVPPGAELRSVIVRGGTAVIDFSEGFRFNPGGREGLEAGLRQVVWAATEFPTVRNVQVLIGGARVDYLGPEGLAIGSPLDRSSFAD